MDIKLLHTKRLPIFSQLQLEEALLRNDSSNWCIINEGSSPAIVLGSSLKPSECVDFEKIDKKSLPLIKRFTGGGCVVVDDNTLFITFIMSKDSSPFQLYPEPIMRWLENFYKTIFLPHIFELKENDFIINNKKCAGNAQYIQKNRWLHHSTFLWDYALDKMAYLLLPKKSPQYRRDRSHEDFLCRIKKIFPSKKYFIDQLLNHLKHMFSIEHVEQRQIEEVLSFPHRKTTKYLLK